MKTVLSDYWMKAIGVAVILLASSSGCSAGTEKSSESAVAVAKANYSLDFEKFNACINLLDKQKLIEDLIDWERLLELAKANKTHFMSALLAELEDIDNDTRPLLEGLAIGAGYDALSDFETDGNAVFQAIAILTFQYSNEKIYSEIAAAGDAGRKLWVASDEYGEIAALIYSVPESLLMSVEPLYDQLVIDRGSLAPSSSPILAEYYSYMAFMPDVNALWSSNTTADWSAATQSFDPAKPVTSTLDFLAEFHPLEFDYISQGVSSVGFESIEDWAAVGDRLVIGMLIVGVERKNPGKLTEILATSVAEMESSKPGHVSQHKVILSFDDIEWAFFSKNYERYQEIVTQSP
ncbi:MAG: hypothetical protein HKN14_00025 [Marinicaulis sp.]|nr:hypothetical protein [Marinicaulis sp.]